MSFTTVSFSSFVTFLCILLFDLHVSLGIRRGMAHPSILQYFPYPPFRISLVGPLAAWRVYPYNPLDIGSRMFLGFRDWCFGY